MSAGWVEDLGEIHWFGRHAPVNTRWTDDDPENERILVGILFDDEHSIFPTEGKPPTWGEPFDLPKL